MSTAILSYSGFIDITNFGTSEPEALNPYPSKAISSSDPIASIEFLMTEAYLLS